MALVSTPLAASTVARLTTSGLVSMADHIVIGRSTHSETAWMDGTLVTRVYFEISETLKGRSAGPVVLVLPGGIDMHHVPPLQLVYPGSPQITTGEDALLFLETLDDTTGTMVLVGFSQGFFHLSPDGKLARRDLAALTLLERGGGASRGANESTETEALLAEVRALLGREVEP